MAGEIQEPVALKFREDSLHSGSISFGRFEAESLSWERRSSFSHNRYLEEVEKYSKPGSVTEKKAYFEAHFRRKALLSQSSPEFQNGTEYQTSENDASENMGNSEEFELNDESYHIVQFNKNSVGSECGRESEVMEHHDREDLGTSHIEPSFESTVNDMSVCLQSRCEHVNPEEAPQIETESVSVIDSEPGREVREEFHEEAGNVDLSCKAIHLSTDNHTTAIRDSASLEHQLESSLKAGSQLGSKTVKAKSKSLGNVTQVQRNVSSELCKVNVKKPTRIERETLRTTKSEKQSPQTATPTTQSVHRTSKTEESTSSRLKVVHANKSENGLNSKRIAEPKPAGSHKVLPKARQTTNRPTETENSAKPGTKHSSAMFNLERDQRAERRKEEKEAEIKELRKSLNFRAKPMPSFYHEAVQRDSHKNKAVSSNTKSNKLSSKSAQGCRAAGRSPSHGKADNHQSHFNSERANASDPPQGSGGTNCSLKSVSSETNATSETHRQEETHTEVAGRKEHSDRSGESSLIHRVSGSSNKVLEGHRFKGKRKVEAGRSINGMVRKDTKSVGVGNASGTRRLAVGVAS